MKNCPTDIKQDDWDWLCQYWSTPEFQRSITKDNTQGEIELYYDTHYSEKKGWVNDEALTRYERMLQIKEQLVPEGSEAPTELEILQEVLGKSRGYIRGLGHGPKPATSYSAHLTLVDIESIALREQIQKQEQELLDMRARLSQIEALMHKFVSNQVDISPQQAEPATMFSMPTPTNNI
ncbi:uncharacterized protein LOC111396520 [Olea europaea var. sylvestris]|uniref:uncharacterized protein LOC111396520 n=1 Tax=Olea europaea var. sylvestris TaxID=158386 RepID=UPI000C1D8A6F|nr:uncharacterized protein LOC111396520 [Olea europaea var. sylvestris]